MKEKCYLYNYKIQINNKRISLTSIIERNYLKDNNSTIDVSYNIYKRRNIFNKIYIRKIDIFINKLLDDIKTSNNLYDIEFNYYYKINNHKYNRNYELKVKCYDDKKKFGFDNIFTFKSLKYNLIKKEIFIYDNLLNSNVNNEEGIIDSKYIIIKRYALSQIVSLYKKNIIDNLNNISNENISIKYNNNSIIFKSNRYDDLHNKLNSGYVITSIYFLNNTKENREEIKLLCSGYYLKNNKVNFLFSNRIFTFKLIDLLNNIKYCDKNIYLQGNCLCFDILTINNI